MSDQLSIESLEGLRDYLSTLKASHVPTMNHYASRDGHGFWHQPTKRDSASLSSTATCVSSLVRGGVWNISNRNWGSSQLVAERLLRTPWKSAGLEENNPFGLSFIAEGILDLKESRLYNGWQDHSDVVSNKISDLLISAVEDESGPFAVAGAVSIKPYPPSAYLTQLTFRVLKRCLINNDIKLNNVTRLVRIWARGEINRQIALITTKSRIADPLQLAYAIIIASASSTEEKTSPEEKALVRSALKIFFDSQNDDGMWPPSQPIFHYPEVGNAQCFEYELITQLLACDPLQDELLKYISAFEVTIRRLSSNAYDLGGSGSDKAVGWASGHHPQIEGPESWSTACVYDAINMLGKLVDEAIRRALFQEIKSLYHAPVPNPILDIDNFAPTFLDARLWVDGDYRSLRETLRDRFVIPIAQDGGTLSSDGKLKPTTPMSAILFGPPGTSKTQLATLISQFLGWPLLKVDPSYLIQDGVDHLYSRANRLFSMLTMSKRIVVLLDEFDEMGRNRAGNADILSRFITTAMLPKLAAINDARKIVFLLATNYVSEFDTAFSRGGRFDMIIQIMPPKKEEKLGFAAWNNTLQVSLSELNAKQRAAAESVLDDLTFLETQQLVARLESNPEDIAEEFTDAGTKCTLNRSEENKTWKVRCKEEERFIRLPNPPGEKLKVSHVKVSSLARKKVKRPVGKEAGKETDS